MFWGRSGRVEFRLYFRLVLTWAIYSQLSCKAVPGHLGKTKKDNLRVAVFITFWHWTSAGSCPNLSSLMCTSPYLWPHFTWERDLYWCLKHWNHSSLPECRTSKERRSRGEGSQWVRVFCQGELAYFKCHLSQYRKACRVSWGWKSYRKYVLPLSPFSIFMQSSHR